MVAIARETAKPHSETKMSAVPIFLKKNLPENHFCETHAQNSHTGMNWFAFDLCLKSSS